MTANDDLESHLKGFATAPFLFVGSGLSRRYLQLETWRDLLAHFAAMTSKPYAYYVTSADGDLTRVASALADEFHDVWWQEARFAASRADFGNGRLGTREGPLKAEIARHVDEALARLPADGELAHEIELLGEAVIDGVITTNFDRFLEQVFDDYKVYTGQDQLLFSDPQGVGEIYKIHGSADDPESLVLSAADFARYRDRNPYLAAKLLTIFVEHPVLFVGYSLTDPNIREILVSVARCLTSDNLPRLQDRLIFINWNPDATEPTFARTMMSIEGMAIPVINFETSSFAGVFAALGSLQRKFPARLLRQMKEHVYELVRTNQPQGRLFVQDLDADTDLAKVDVVFGVGMQERLSNVGYVGIAREDVLGDLLLSESRWDAARMVEDALPVLLRRSPKSFVPVFRYLRGAGLLDDMGDFVEGAEIDERLRSRAEAGLKRIQPTPGTPQRRRSTRLLREAGGTFKGACEKCTLTDLAAVAPLIPTGEIDPDELLDEIVSRRPAEPDTAWAKLVCLYDILKYSRPPTDVEEES